MMASSTSDDPNDNSSLGVTTTKPIEGSTNTQSYNYRNSDHDIFAAVTGLERGGGQQRQQLAQEEKKDDQGDMLSATAKTSNDTKIRQDTTQSSTSANTSAAIAGAAADRNANDILILKRHMTFHPKLLRSLGIINSKDSTTTTITTTPLEGNHYNNEPFSKGSTSSSSQTVPTSNAAATATTTISTSIPPPMKWIIRIVKLVVHLVLVGAFAALGASYGLRSAHKDYFVPMLQRARRTDAHLMEEFTYYDRECTAEDVTVSWPDQIPELILGSNATTDSPLEQHMKHGALVFPQLLEEATISSLREFVVDKNEAVRGTAAEYPVSQGENRISYGIEAAEHPAVIRALKEIHDTTELKDLLEGLVGPDPAVTEITAITASYGCPNQEWHADVKQDGNGLKWSRTYSHSYSLFIPLQDTTKQMGATDLCPGTHFCANYLYRLCEEMKIGMDQVVAENNGIWKAGDGALLNQQVWHRGPRHSDPNAGDRIVFIVSFIARPNDTRQLSRGTYFHQKWNMWGHTFKDLGDSFISMAWPFNMLRCLHIWKPHDRAWGYDLIMATAMRIANIQLGCEPEDLSRFVQVLERLGFPAWLDGTIDYQSPRAWQMYISETIENIYNFLWKVNKILLAGYLGVSLVSAIFVQRRFKAGGTRVLVSASMGIFVSHVLVLGVTLWLLAGLRGSEWAVGISSGRTLQRPFPPVDFSSPDPFVSTGSTTFPTRQDVLVGTRLASKTLGAYSRLLDFHPGNLAFREHIEDMVMMGGSDGASGAGGWSLHNSYEQGLPPIFCTWILDTILEDVERWDGRFLQQDYRTGDWRLMNTMESREYARLILSSGTYGVAAEVKRGIDFLLGDYRFGILRGTAMAKMSQLDLHNLTKKLFGTLSQELQSPQRHGQVQMVQMARVSLSFFDLSDRSSTKHEPAVPQSKRWTHFPKSPMSDIRPGSNVLYRNEVPATVVYDYGNEHFDVVFSGEVAEEKGIGISNVPLHMLRKPPPLLEGSRVSVNYYELGEWFTGNVVRVRPNGLPDVAFDDGDFEDAVDTDRFVVFESDSAASS